MVTKNKTTNMWVAQNGNKWDANQFTKAQATEVALICKRLYLIDRVNLTLNEVTQILIEKEAGFAKRAEVVAKEEAIKEAHHKAVCAEISASLLSQYTDLQATKRTLLHLNTFYKRHDDTFYTDAIDLRNSIIDVCDEFAVEVAKSVKKFKKITEKQAYILAKAVIDFNNK